MKKLTQRQAKSLFEKGKKIYLKPSKISMQVMQYSPWFHWCQVKKDEYQEGISFEQIVKTFKYNDCNRRNGKCVHFYAYVPDAQLPQIQLSDGTTQILK